jgi:hypothetical protein
MLRAFVFACAMACSLTPASALENPYFHRPTPVSSATERFVLANPRVQAQLRVAWSRFKLVYSKMSCQDAGYNATYVVHLKNPTMPRIGGGFFTVGVNGGGIAGRPFVTTISDFTLLR